MTETEGVIRYRLDYRPGALPADVPLFHLFRWFTQCRQKDLIGRDPKRYGGYAYGNLSLRADPGFVISGTQTGAKPGLSADDLSWVRKIDPAHNRLSATGPARPSSEAMTHGQVYLTLPAARAVIHVHSKLIWRRAQRLGLALTGAEAGYGTPAMASEVERLLRAAATNHGAFAMGGHEDGIVAYAEDMDTAGGLILDLLQHARSERG